METCKAIREAAVIADESKDFVSYATLIDLHAGDPSVFSESEASDVLRCLAQTLRNHPVLARNVAWDIPELLMRYLDEFLPSDQHLAEHKNQGPYYKGIPQVCNIICELGNPKELFLRTSELITRLGEDEVDGDDFIETGDEPKTEQKCEPLEPEHEVENEEASGIEKTKDEPSHSKYVQRNRSYWITPEFNNYVLPREVHVRNYQFSYLVEIMRFSLLRIKTQVPSRFLHAAVSSVVAVGPTLTTNWLSSTMFARRMYILARDFELDMEGASEKEYALVRSGLRDALYHGIIFSTCRILPKWSIRLGFEIKNRVAAAPPLARQAAFNTGIYTKRVSEALTRLYELALSYDVEPQEIMRLKDVKEIEKKPQTEVFGLFLLATHEHYIGDRKLRPSIQELATLLTALIPAVSQTSGLFDACVFWSMWVGSYTTQAEVQALPKPLFAQYIQVLFMVCARTEFEDLRSEAYRVIAKLLLLQDRESGYELLVDTFENSPFFSILDGAVQLLKMLIVGRTRAHRQTKDQDEIENVSELYASMSIENKLELTAERRLKIASLAESHADDVIAMDNGITPALLSWFNLLTVVDTDKETTQRFYDKLSAHVPKCDDTQRVLLEMALETMQRLRLSNS